MKSSTARREPPAKRKPFEGGVTPRESGTEILSDGVLLVLKFVESHLNGSELELLKELKPGEYVPLETLLPLWELLTKRIPDELRAAIKGMVYRNKRILAETGAKSPADALRFSNVLYQTFNRGPRLGGREVVAEGDNEVIVDDSTWPGCGTCVWFIEAYVRAFGARAVRIEHLKPCRLRGERQCRYRVRWAGVKQVQHQADPGSSVP